MASLTTTSGLGTRIVTVVLEVDVFRDMRDGCESVWWSGAHGIDPIDQRSWAVRSGATSRQSCDCSVVHETGIHVLMGGPSKMPRELLDRLNGAQV